MPKIRVKLTDNFLIGSKNTIKVLVDSSIDPNNFVRSFDSTKFTFDNNQPLVATFDYS